MNALTKTDDRPKRELLEVVDAVPVLDTARFEHMQRIATVMARGTLLPESLYMAGPKDKKELLPIEQVISNCFLIVNQSVRWGLDPFAVAQSVAVVHGKLCYEGKLVAAVLDAKMGIRLHHYFVGDPASEAYRVFVTDVELDDAEQASLKPGFQKNGVRVLDGSVAEWKTTGNNSPWSAQKNFRRMLIYRGTRDWCRIFEPALMLGVYTPDEMIDMSEASRASRATDVTPSVLSRLQARQEPTSAREGFDQSFVTRETENLASGQAIQIDEPSEGDPRPASDAGSGERSPAAAPESVASAADQAGEPASEAPDEPAAGSPVALSADDRERLRKFAARVVNVIGGDSQFLIQEAGRVRTEEGIPAGLATDKARSITKYASQACDDFTGKDALDRSDAIEMIAGIVGCEPKELAL